MRKWICLASLLFIVSGARAQTIANPSFEQNAPGAGQWNFGPIPGWTVAGSGGLWEPSTAEYPTLPDGQTVAWLNGGTLAADTGVPAPANSTITVIVAVGHRSDMTSGVTYALSLTAGVATIGSCVISGNTSTIPLGTWQDRTLTCAIGATTPSGNLALVLTSGGTQVDFDNVRMKITTGPPVLVFPGNGNGTGFSATFSLTNISQMVSCGPTDGNCSLILRFCPATLPPAVPVCLTGQGTLSVEKIADSGTQTQVLVNVGP